MKTATRSWTLACGLAGCLGSEGLIACAEPPAEGLEVAINSVAIEVDRALPEQTAALTLTVELVARRRSLTARVEDLRAVTLPDGDIELRFEPRLLGPAGEVGELPMGKDEELLVRVLNASATNAEAEPTCGRPMDLSIVMADGPERPEDSATVTPRCSN